jgi:hypothetical protein
MATSRAQLRALMPAWLRGTGLGKVWIDAWIENGDSNQAGQLALEAVRADDRYDSIFAGNRRPDGSLIHDENTYLSIIESFENTLLSVNVNPNLFRGKFPELIAGLTSPREFTNRVEAVVERVAMASAGVRQFYAQRFGLEMSREAIVASAIDPDVGQLLLNRRISMAEVGGEAFEQGFNIKTRMARRLVREGLDARGADELFAVAAYELPVLQTLAQRHADPDDTFNLTEFVGAAIFDDPEQRRRIRRLMSQERASFTGGAANISFTEDREFGTPGLNPI